MSTYFYKIQLCAFLLPIACNGNEKNDEGQIEDTAVSSTETGLEGDEISSEDDLDGDGISNEDDVDADGDGVPVTEDCDDTNAELLSTSEDLDCDGILDSEDTDKDGDGIESTSDCDDSNPESSSIAEDADCDGVLTAQDCDDGDAALGSSLYDVDCDGYETSQDCDDRDPASTLTENDSDCDGILNEEDGFPDDPNENADSDGDGVGDNADLCDGGDDSVDEDGNGVPDECDDPGWLDCSAERAIGTGNYQFVLNVAGDRIGSTVSYAGDVDGDGMEDLLVAANPIHTSSNTRRIYLVLGSSITPGVDFDLANADYTFTSGETDDDYFGAGAIGIGDYDGDGLDDLLFSAEEHGFYGRVYLVLGGSLGANSEISMTDADTIFYTNYNFGLGHSIAAVGDVNGDGLADISFTEYGRAYLFLGSSTIQSEVHAASADLMVIGSSGQYKVSGAGDVDGDGLDDWLIGEFNYNELSWGRRGRGLVGEGGRR